MTHARTSIYVHMCAERNGGEAKTGSSTREEIFWRCDVDIKNICYTHCWQCCNDDNEIYAADNVMLYIDPMFMPLHRS